MKNRCSGMAILSGNVYRCERDNGHAGPCLIVESAKLLEVVPVAHKLLEMKDASPSSLLRAK